MVHVTHSVIIVYIYTHIIHKTSIVIHNNPHTVVERNRENTQIQEKEVSGWFIFQTA